MAAIRSDGNARQVTGVVVNLRAHHLLCLHGFRGLGYSQAFIDRMSQVSQCIRQGGAHIRLVDGADIICEACPHCLDGKCSKNGIDSEGAVRSLDREVLASVEEDVGNTLAAMSILARTRTAFSAKGLNELCGDCQWLQLGHCEEGLKQGLAAPDKI